MQAESKLYNVNEAAERLRISPWTVRSWLSQGRLPRIHAGRRVLVSEADIQKFLQRCQQERQR